MGGRGERRSDLGRSRCERRLGLPHRAADGHADANDHSPDTRTRTVGRACMKRFVIAGAALLVSLSGSLVQAQAIPAEYQQVLSTLGKQGDFKDNVLKVNIPRNDVKVTVAGVATPTPFGFGGWVALTKASDGNQVLMGDLVLLQDEVNPVMSALLDAGFDVTALHNHFFWDTPRMFYMHVHGHGSAADLTRKLKPAVDLIGKRN